MAGITTGRKITDYPRCNALGVLVTIPEGDHLNSYSQFRVDPSLLMKALSPVEAYAWEKNKGEIEGDDIGWDPGPTEQFLEWCKTTDTLSFPNICFGTPPTGKENPMATKGAAPRSRSAKSKAKNVSDPAKGKGKAGADKTQQPLDPTFFTAEDDKIESLVIELEKAQSAFDKAKEKRNTAQASLDGEMTGQGIDVYHCYKTKFKVVMKPKGHEVKVVPILGDEPTPYRPFLGATAAPAV